jgi:GAF domain-containing protein
MGCEIRQLTTLYRLTRLLAMGTQGASLLRTILKEALGLTGSRGGQVLLLRPDRRTLLVEIGEGEGLADGEEVSADAFPWADVIREGKVVRLPSTMSDTDDQPADRLVTLGIPLLARGDVLGILTLWGLSETWARHDQEPFLETLAHIAAHALHNDSLYRDVLRQKAELCTLIEISRDIAASLDLDEVLRRVVRHAVRLLRVQAASLMLVDDDGQTLHVRATYGSGQTWTRHPPLDTEASFIGEVVRSSSPLAVLDLQ